MRTRFTSHRVVRILPAFVLLTLLAATVSAEVERIEISSRSVFADGMEFGDSGAYEKIRGRLFYAVDPGNAANAPIVDLELAPRGQDGKLRFQGDFILIKPIDLQRGNGRLLYDVNNRGNLYMLRHINGGTRTNDPSSPEDAGNGFLMEQGYSLLWSAWNWDVRSGDDRLQIELPIATENGKPIRQRIVAEIVNSFGRVPSPSMPLAWGNSRCYPALDPEDNSGAVLTVREAPTAERTRIPNDSWSFSRSEDGVLVADPTHLSLRGGFLPGKIYELTYETQNPRVVGLGLAAVRDAISFFHFEGTDRYGNPSPLADAGGDGKWESAMDLAYIFGVSQSGRFITHMLWQGFHVDESGRLVFEGAWIHVAGGGKGGFNHRFAQTTHHPSHLEGNSMPADHPPFNFLPDGSPSEDDVLAEAKRLGRIPKIIIMNNTLEYWTRSASLVHTDLTGTRDAAIHPDVRYYMTNGAPHGGAGTRSRTVTEHERNPLKVDHLQRAMLVNLDRWVTDGIEPPPSRYPRIDRGELIPAARHARDFPAIPGMRHPGRNLLPPRVDYGPAFWTEGIFSVVPPEAGTPYPTLVPAFDEDGNGVGGIRLPELTVPLGTYQGWNPRKADYGAGDYLTRFDGSFWAFPGSEEEREKTGDPRPSVDSRYESKHDYVAMVTVAARELAAGRFLLPQDAESYIEFAQRLAWPPETTDGAPHWRLGPEGNQAGAAAPAKSLAGDIQLESPEAAPAEAFKADIRLSCAPGLRIYLDGALVGISSTRDNGLLLKKVSKGPHDIRVEKEGFEAQSFKVEIVDRPVELRVVELTPDDSALLEGKGSLRVTSKPLRCTVRLSGMLREKTQQRLNLSYLPAGEYRMVVSIPGRELSSKIRIKDRQKTIVEVSFMKGDEPFAISYIPE